MKRKRFNNVFRTPSYRRAMDAVDDEFYAEQARKRREAEAQAAETKSQEQDEPQGENKNG